MNQEQLHRAAARTLRAGIFRKHPLGETRDHLLARLEVIIEQSRLRIEKELIAAERPSPENDVGVTLTTDVGLHRAVSAISAR